MDPLEVPCAPLAAAEATVGVGEELAGLFPAGGLRRGSTALVSPASGGVSLALALAASLTRRGSWVAAVGLRSLGLLAAAELGVDLERFALVPDPGHRWLLVAAALVDGMDLLLVGPPAEGVRPSDARRLAARVRERGTVMVVVAGEGGGPGGRRPGPGWPQPADIRLVATRQAWEGLGQGCGHLGARRVEVLTSGRGAAARGRSALLWLPGPGGAVLPCGGGAGRPGGDLAAAPAATPAAAPAAAPTRAAMGV